MSTGIIHPSEYIDKAAVDLIRSKASEAELLGRLYKDQLDWIYKKKWFKMFVPTRYDGLGFTLPEVVRVEEALGWIDGSIAWEVTLCSGAGWFIGFVNEKIAKEFFGADTICIAGSGAPTGIAEETENGYEITGVWKYASGALDATAFTFNCEVRDGGKTINNPDGRPRILTFIVRADEVKIQHTWNSMGMKATGSHSFSAYKLLIPRERSFVIDPSQMVLADTVYRYPFLQLAETTLAANISGMAVRFIDLATTIIKRKEELANLCNATEKMRTLRQAFFNKVDVSWDALASGGIGHSMLAEVSEVSLDIVKYSREIVNSLHPYCGLAATRLDSEINLVWRNFHTATQHSLLNR